MMLLGMGTYEGMLRQSTLSRPAHPLLTRVKASSSGLFGRSKSKKGEERGPLLPSDGAEAAASGLSPVTPKQTQME